MADASEAAVRPYSRRALAIALGLLLLAAFLAVPPYSLEAKARLIGYPVCHQQPDRSFFIGGRQLPICARDTGTYLGAMVTLAFIAGTQRRRASELPGPVALAIFALGFAFFAVDGINSYGQAIPFLPQLYTPDNRLRLLSGVMMGSGIIAILVPLFNYTVWARSDRVRVLDGRRFLVLAALLAVAYSAVLWSPAWLYAPLALISAVGVLLVLSIVNGLLAVVLLRQEQRGGTWLDVAYVLSLGLFATAVELGSLGLLRHFLEAAVA